ncbi:MAG: ribosome maturation factor RimM [Gammaproteobacteria bacterium]|nr:ribosome maturation factor RimM [Gammaproteobacteria bacterium]|tara:strand:+ start:155 stop:694 length:540 start_codon:yes stop_codon:yes gene_type:complete
MTLDNDRKRVILGQVGKVHGIKGWLRLNSFTTPPDKILAYARLLGAIEGELQVLEIDQYRRQGETLVVHFKGFDNPETSRSIVGKELSIYAEDLPALDKGSFYWHELEGMEVLNEAGQTFGVIDHLLETGANDVLVVLPIDGSIDDRERLIPYIKGSVIKNIDTEKRRVLVNWEAGYLD